MQSGNYHAQTVSASSVGPNRYDDLPLTNVSDSASGKLGAVDFSVIGNPFFVGESGIGDVAVPVASDAAGASPEMPTSDNGLIGVDMINAYAGEGNELLHAYCFAAETQVKTKRGLLPITDVQIGDEVWAVPDNTPHTAGRWQKVEKTFANAPAALLNVHVAGLAQPIRATHNHPWFVVNQGWTPTAALQPGDQLLTADNRTTQVTDLFDNGEVEPVFNLCVAEDHTYFVGGDNCAVLVHNRSVRYEAGFKQIINLLRTNCSTIEATMALKAYYEKLKGSDLTQAELGHLYDYIRYAYQYGFDVVGLPAFDNDGKFEKDTTAGHYSRWKRLADDKNPNLNAILVAKHMGPIAEAERRQRETAGILLFLEVTGIEAISSGSPAEAMFELFMVASGTKAGGALARGIKVLDGIDGGRDVLRGYKVVNGLDGAGDGLRIANAASDTAHHATASDRAQGVLDGINVKLSDPNNRFGQGFYVAEDGVTAVAEVKGAVQNRMSSKEILNAVGEEGKVIGNTVVLKYDMDLSKVKVLDLTKADTAANWGYQASNSRPQTQRLAEVAASRGYSAIRFKSTQGPGVNVAFLSNEAANAALKVRIVTPAR